MNVILFISLLATSTHQHVEYAPLKARAPPIQIEERSIGRRCEKAAGQATD
jgi:hypothetical protein